MQTNNNNAQESNTKIKKERCEDNDDQLQVKKVTRTKILKF
jgi:hypothetical protein